MEDISGIQAIQRAEKDSGVGRAVYVPGYPITEVAEAVGAELCVNEKVAMEIALGASSTGIRSIAIVKQMGMNLLADPLVISSNHTIGSGLVVLAGDDLGPRGSQAEMDSRYYGQIAEVPVFDPRDPASLYNSILEAYSLSERLRIPAIVRITKRLVRSQGPPATPLISRRSGQKFERSVWDLTVMARHLRHHHEIMPLAEEASEATTLNRIEISSHVGIIASGYPAALADGLGVSLLSIGYAHPLPWKLIRRFVDGHRTVLIAEEPEPFIESQMRMIPKVRGKLTGHLPFGPLDKTDLSRALQDLEKKTVEYLVEYETAEERGRLGICEDCPFGSLYRALFSMNVFVAGDAGCAIHATREPFSSVDVVFGLGSAIGVASGFREKGIAVMGDFAFAHTGLIGLVNAAWRRYNLLAILVHNGMAAMTGGQEAPDLAKLVEVLVPVRHLLFPAPYEEIEDAIKQELARPGTSAIIASGRCNKYNKAGQSH